MEQFECIRRERPSVLILVSDGGRSEKEANLINESRAVFAGIDWNCEVHRLFWDVNTGMYATGAESTRYIWQNFDRCIWLEDDIMFAEGYIRFCADMLKRYEDDERIMAVCGMNHEGVSEGPNADYFFSREASIWGLASWRRAWCRPEEILSEGYEYERDRIAENARWNPDFRRRLRGYSEDAFYEGHLAGGEFWNALQAFGNGRLYIIPKRNMICNKGYDLRSTHADDLKLLPKGMRRIFGMKTYSPPDVLKDPILVISDMRYERSVYRIMAVGHPLVRIYRKTMRAIKILAHRGPKEVLSKLGNVINPRREN